MVEISDCVSYVFYLEGCVCVYARVIVYIYNMHQAAKIDACLWLKPCEKKNNSYQTTMFLKMSPLTLLVDTPTY